MEQVWTEETRRVLGERRQAQGGKQRVIKDCLNITKNGGKKTKINKTGLLITEN